MNTETTKTIMVVEDEVIIGMDIRNSLKKLGYHVPALISSGEKAMTKAAELQPNLILMDIMLKGSVDGIEAAKKIREELLIPVVFLTAHTDKNTLDRAKETEPFGYIVKPFEERELHTTVEIAMARYRAETEVRKALEKEKELNDLKSRFVSMVSHEFRTPLSTILFSASLLEHYGFQWSDDKKKMHLQRIQIAVKQMNGLLENVLVMGRAEAGKLDLHPTLVNLAQFCAELVEEIQIELREKHRLEFAFQGVCEKVEIDERLLRHILSNLFSNAIKYSPEGGVIKLELTCHSNEIIFVIEDEGIGILPEDQEHLFERFHRGRNVGTISGTGLGLSIVKRAVDLQGGTITCQSEVGRGTQFTIQLPRFEP